MKPDLDDSDHQIEKTNDRHRWISEAAYYKAQARGFAPGHEADDWLAAEKDYAEMLISAYLAIVEEDGGMTVVGLRHLAKTIGVQNTEFLKLRSDLIRAIQAASHLQPCFQLDPDTICTERNKCQWQAECQKLIAGWNR